MQLIMNIASAFFIAATIAPTVKSANAIERNPSSWCWVKPDVVVFVDLSI